MTPLHGIACFYDVGFGARAVSRKTPIYFILVFHGSHFDINAVALISLFQIFPDMGEQGQQCNDWKRSVQRFFKVTSKKLEEIQSQEWEL